MKRLILLALALAIGVGTNLSAQGLHAKIEARKKEAEKAKPTEGGPDSCPEAGEVVPLGKATSISLAKGYADCDIVVEATFLKMGNEGSALGKYNTKANTTFQILEKGGTPGEVTGTFAGTPKANADVLFTLKPGDPIVLRGYPVPIGVMRTTYLVVFHADSVTRK